MMSNGFLLLVPLLLIFFIFKAIKNQIRNYSGTATFVFTFVLYLFEFIQIRNIIAVSIFFYSLKYLISNQRIKYFLFVILACSFHYSSVIYLVLPLIIGGNRHNKSILSSISLFVVIIISIYLVALLGNSILFFISSIW